MCYIGLFVLLVVNAVFAEDIFKYNIEDASKHFDTFIRTYNKEYDEAEYMLRYEIFKQNLETINAWNEETNSSDFGITKFSDLTTEEFSQMYTGYLPSNQTDNVEDLDDRSGDEEYIAQDIPESFDWRDQNVVSIVKNQGSCRSCWAFATTGLMESAYAIKYKQSVLLSEQQLVDCDKTSNGCQGGYPIKACEYLKQNGAMTEDSYPYEARDNVCRYSGSAKVKVKKCSSIKVKTEDELAYKLYTLGPLAIGIDSHPLKHYNKQTVLTNACQNDKIDHGVLLVGYGTDENGVKYWTVKNSWGKDFNEHGYFRMQRGVNCLNLMADPAVAAEVE